MPASIQVLPLRKIRTGEALPAEIGRADAALASRLAAPLRELAG